MNIKTTLSNLRLLPFAFAFFAGILLEPFWIDTADTSPELSAFNLAPIEPADHMGRSANTYNFTNHFRKAGFPAKIEPRYIEESTTALKHTKRLLRKTDAERVFKVGDLQFQAGDLAKVASLLEAAKTDESIQLEEVLNAHQIAGRDNVGNVFYTGYFAPVIAVSDKKEGAFQYPIYQYPKNWKGKLPTREDIEGEKQVLSGKNLEIAYARNPLDIYFMQVQGSGYIEYPDGRQQLLSYDGANKRSYRSIGKYMINQGYTTPDKVSINSIKKYFRSNPEKANEILFSNPSYVFFKPGKQAVNGAAQIPLTTLHSVAVDPKYIPFGSILLGKVPIANAKGEFLHHEYRLLYAQDTGGAIKGPGRIDIFSGVGYKGKSLAGDTHHYGELWLLLPNELGNRP